MTKLCALLTVLLTIAAIPAFSQQQGTPLEQATDKSFSSLRDGVEGLIGNAQSAVQRLHLSDAQSLGTASEQLKWWADCAKDMGCWDWLKPPTKTSEVK